MSSIIARAALVLSPALRTLLALALPFLPLLAAPVALADALPLRTTGQVGRPARPSNIRIRATDEGAIVEARLGSRRVEATLPIPAAIDASVETHRLAGGRAVSIVRARNEAGREAFVLIGARGGRPELLFTGHADLRGDPGERRRDVIEVEDRTGDGAADIIVGVELESIRVCGQDRTLLSPRAVDPGTGALRPVELRRLPADSHEVAIEAASTTPGPEGPPLLGGVSFSQASSSVGSPEDPSLVSPPSGLGDDDPATHWAEGHGGAGRWEFATARLEGRGDVRAIAITLAAAPIVRPSHLWLVGDAGPRLRVTIPSTAAAGAIVWVVPPESLAWRCLSVVLDDAAETGAVGLAGVAVYGDLDFGDGLALLVEELVADGPRGARAAEVLSRAGAPARDAVIEVWPTLTPTGRRRAIRVLSSHTDHPAAVEALAEAAADRDGEVQGAAVEALVAIGPRAAAALGRLASVPTEGGDRAAEALVAVAPNDARVPLLAAIDAEGGADRPGLRRALRSAYRETNGEDRERYAEWARGAAPGPAAAAALALAKAGDVGTAIAVSLVGRGITNATRFEDVYRLVTAAYHLPSDPTVDAWLAGLVAGSDAWMLRSQSMLALGARRSPRLRGAARGALEDPYPRVRLAAAIVVAGQEGTLRAVSTLARRDPWPMVRAGATQALAEASGALPILRAAAGDRSKRVRAAAVLALTTRGETGAADVVAARLEDADEWPVVIEAAIAYASELCVPALVDPLVTVLRRGLRPDAWAPDIDSAVLAIGALRDLGGSDAAAAIRSATSERAPEPIRAAAARAQEQLEGPDSPGNQGRCAASRAP
ncbi:MAG: HEAT repeat domain-containing protein [Deltaproteobacteria bacterium]|nr:HEAT repeat domain-containing protein [Deltaproteobacteria bacterium]